LFVPYFLVFLFPLGVYLLVLATINRRERPLMIAGVWDALMMSLGLSGILLWVGPALLGAFYEKGLLPGAADKTSRQFDEIWALYPWIWVSYYVLVLCGQALMVISRRDKTSVYNVDAAALANVVGRVLADNGFRTSQDRGIIVFEKAIDPPVSSTGIVDHDAYPLKAPPIAADKTAETGAVDIDSFPPLRHATLHWHADDRVRRTIEADVDARLLDAVTAENPSVTWLLGASGAIFAFVIVGAIFFILVGLKPR
jgi:hypothetical protein